MVELSVFIDLYALQPSFSISWYFQLTCVNAGLVVADTTFRPHDKSMRLLSRVALSKLCPTFLVYHLKGCVASCAIRVDAFHRRSPLSSWLEACCSTPHLYQEPCKCS